MKKRNANYHFGRCQLCETKKLIRWLQRGISNPEWIDVCSDCEHKITKVYRRNRKPKDQLDLFAK